uniref:CD82 molecule n=1 Tax=Podarcis muralis TaxID=64176 RepID=A0A670JF30_PODMU
MLLSVRIQPAHPQLPSLAATGGCRKPGKPRVKGEFPSSQDGRCCCFCLLPSGEQRVKRARRLWAAPGGWPLPPPPPPLTPPDQEDWKQLGRRREAKSRRSHIALHFPRHARLGRRCASLVVRLPLQILGAVILGFGIWILVDKNSFISVLQTSSSSLKIGAYILIGVGAVTMLMGFLGCIGAVNEIRCLLGLLRKELDMIAGNLIQNYNPYDDKNRTLENAWDYVQLQLSCCGWAAPENWKNNTFLQDGNQTSYPCSCGNDSTNSLSETGFCSLGTVSNTTTVEDWPVRKQGCREGVQNWLQENLGIILGVCAGVAVIELLGMILSICLCKNIHTEDYTKVPKY